MPRPHLFRHPPQATAEHYLDQFIDRSVSPRDDFFHFAVGKWLREHPIPKSEVWWGVGDVIQEETYERLRAISEEAGATHPVPGGNEQKIGDFWARREGHGSRGPGGIRGARQ